MNYIVSTSPHLHPPKTSAQIMRDVCIALCPALIASICIFGWRSLLVTAVCVAAAVAAEYFYEQFCKIPITVKDFSAVITGMLVAFNVPVTLPLWQGALGSIVAIILVKQFFGGLGKNFANPAIVGRIFLFLTFSKTMTAWVFPDLVSSATPLAVMRDGDMAALPSMLQLFLGNRAGCLGETSVLALLAGGIYLLARKIISWHTPVAFIGTVFVLSWLLTGDAAYAVCQILSGGLVLGAFFMATDYVTTPQTEVGRLIFGLGCGLLTVLIRQWGSYTEGVSFAILFMNILTPYISKWTRHKPFGGVKA